MDDIGLFDKLISELFSPPSTPTPTTISNSLPSFLFNAVNNNSSNLGRTSQHKPLSVESQQFMAALLYASQLIESLAPIINIYLPYFNLNKKLLKRVNWTREEFTIYLFRLKYSVIMLCLWLGLSPNLLDISTPFANIYQLSLFFNKNDINVFNIF